MFKSKKKEYFLLYPFQKDMYVFVFCFVFLKYDLSLPWMSGQNEQWDWRVCFGCVAESQIKQSPDFSGAEKSEMLQTLSSKPKGRRLTFCTSVYSQMNRVKKKMCIILRYYFE